MARDGNVNIDATARHAEVLISSGVRGLIVLGSLGENQSLTADEKRTVAAAMVEAVAGRVPVLSGVAESSTAEAIRYVRDGERLGLDGFMVMPGMLYKGDARETMTHFRSVARATGLPIMVYNNPISYANDLTPEMFAQLADVPNFVALKESSGDPRRITDLHNVIGGRYAIFTGVDDLALEASILGIDGWVAGTGIAFPRENQYFWELTRTGAVGKGARDLPLVHAAAPSRHAREVRPVHQTRRPGMRPRLGMGAPAPPSAHRPGAKARAENHSRRHRHPPENRGGGIGGPPVNP